MRVVSPPQQIPPHTHTCPHCTAKLQVDEADISRVPNVRGFWFQYSCGFCQKVVKFARTPTMGG